MIGLYWCVSVAAALVIGLFLGIYAMMEKTTRRSVQRRGPMLGAQEAIGQPIGGITEPVEMKTLGMLGCNCTSDSSGIFDPAVRFVVVQSGESKFVRPITVYVCPSCNFGLTLDELEKRANVEGSVRP